MRRYLFFCLLCVTPVCMVAQNGNTELDKLRKQVNPYLEKVEQEPEWLLSRLQMYWATHATDVYVNNETFERPGGDRAPLPTVKFTGTRGTRSYYNRPKLEDVIPYDDDEDGNVSFLNAETGRREKAHPSKTGRNIESLNNQILGIARNAANIYSLTGEQPYGMMALNVLDTYLKGIYHRNPPTDTSHGHMQTLYGMTSCEVIHEDALKNVTETYGFLLHPEAVDAKSLIADSDRDIYDEAMKKWAEVIKNGGVPHNNWDIIQANYIVMVALVLRDDSAYIDGKGRQYYLDYVVNKSDIRQWSIKRLADYGFDPENGIWSESPGYSTMVVGEFATFADMMYRKAGKDLFKEMPIIEKATFAMPQYLFPNRMICGFGDTHPNYLGTSAIETLHQYALQNGNADLQKRTETLWKAVGKDAPANEIEQYVSQVFYAPKVSWVMQRSGMDKNHDLAVSLNGSLGNHMHANGISMELYGKGFVLGPDGGIGRYLYSGSDYTEYYSRFPAHNTVCVDGVSDYAVMMSQHGFELVSRYPDNSSLASFEPASFTQVAFLEPETNSDQQRTNGIVKTPNGGYYVDIFRSRRKDGNDKFHDYFYHNIGQRMSLSASDGTSLNLPPTDELAFAGGHLYAYSYIYDKESTATDRDVKAVFSTDCPDGHTIDMTMWMQGSTDREVFKALSPVNLEYERLGSFMPYNVGEQAVLTYVARQSGNAWNHPFVAVFEPSSSDEPSEIASVEFFKPKSKGESVVGICVKLKDGRTDYVFSAPEPTKMSYKGMKVNASYAVFSDGKRLICK